MHRDLIIAVVLLVVSFGAGWTVQGWRLDAKIEKLNAAHAHTVLQAESKARETEQKLSAAAQDARKQSDAKTKQIRANLELALSELRNRPQRSMQVPPVAGVSCPTTGQTGAELFREDADFLIREAARADELEAALQQCEATYNAVREKVN